MKQNNEPNAVPLNIDARVASDLQEMSKAAGTSDANLLASLVWMGKKAFGREVQIKGKDENQTLSIKSFSELDKIDAEGGSQKRAITGKAAVAAPVQSSATETSADDAEEEKDEDFPEDYDDYYPRGFLDSPQATGTVTLEQKREDTRGRLAVIYTLATFTMFVLGFVVSILDAAIRGSSIIDNLTKILPLLSGIFLGSLGFVLGYYFRKLEKDQSTVQD